MRTDWKINGKDSLILFFSGWAMDPHPTSHLVSEHSDVCTCFDYSTLETDRADRWARYGTIHLVAWSMGVWAAERVLAAHGITPRTATAVNGTPYPVHDRWGIPPETVRATCENLSPAALLRFFRRTVGGAGAIKRLSDRLPRREALQARGELEAILRESERVTERIRWDKALLSTRDAVFPPDNLREYWNGRTRTLWLDEPHYPFPRYRTWEELTGE